MTQERKNEIIRMRELGYGYDRIADETGLPASTVRYNIHRYSGQEQQNCPNAISYHSARVMDKELFKRVVLYQSTMSLIRTLLDDNIINDEEYRSFETHFKEKYGFTNSVIYV